MDLVCRYCGSKNLSFHFEIRKNMSLLYNESTVGCMSPLESVWFVGAKCNDCGCVVYDSECMIGNWPMTREDLLEKVSYYFKRAQNTNVKFVGEVNHG